MHPLSLKDRLALFAGALWLVSTAIYIILTADAYKLSQEQKETLEAVGVETE